MELRHYLRPEARFDGLDALIRQMDADSASAGRMSITAYLMTLFPKEKASRIMYLMTQL